MMMLDITKKITTLRTAVAEATVTVGSVETIDAIKNKTVPKGDVFASSKATGLLGIKKTADLLPDCHPMPIEFASVEYDIQGLDINIKVTVKTIYKTGVEVEAMHGASIVALNIYDMLKPIDKNILIKSIRLVEKNGGKSDFVDKYRKDLRAVVVVCSDSISAGQKEDKAGKGIISSLEKCEVQIVEYVIIPDEVDEIQKVVEKYSNDKVDLIIFTGGTGLSVRDVTPEAIVPLLDREIPGIAEAIRSYGQERTPYSMLSRSLAGVKNQSLILALPGSTKGAQESMDAMFPHILHIFRIFKGARHD
ncbi:MAG: bifunctional molybdenum cofactor biosynthesis protein MoaC/MoaB [Crocinitomicaceae bacterium]|nr:bifunctional molybdenum cofactor biosynthesis protein MoaC/MoaB [Crocinitomicaceae bacterium]